MKRDIEVILREYKPGRREDLIPILQSIQEDWGYLSEDAIVSVGRFLGLSTTKIYGLATFYDMFRFVPYGKVHIRICNGTSCYLNGSGKIIERIMEETNLVPGETSQDGSISFEVVSCMGGCQSGPVISVNGEYYTHIKADRLPVLLEKLKHITESE
jgi:NADH-quinone oxidoreductase subunit E